MQARRLTTTSRPKRRGFTLIELLVVISIIATLMSLLLPAIQNAREAARRTQCLNNQRNIAVAMTGWATAHANQLPAFGYFIEVAGLMGPQPQRSWVVELLPYLDQQPLFDRWDKTSALNSPVGPTGILNPNTVAIGGTNPLCVFSIPSLACPDDESAFHRTGGLSYVVNAGFSDSIGSRGDHNLDAITLNNPEAIALNWMPGIGGIDTQDQAITKSTGVFWSKNESTTFQPSQPSANLGRIYDGVTNTLMIGENLSAGFDSESDLIGPDDFSTTWASPSHKSCAFMAPIVLSSAPNPTPSLVFDAAPGYDVVLTGLDNIGPFPNDGIAGPEGERPFLSSLHPGVVVVGFCDGSVKPLNDGIDKSVYLRLMTPSGTLQKSGFTAESPLSGDSF